MTGLGGTANIEKEHDIITELVQVGERAAGLR